MRSRLWPRVAAGVIVLSAAAFAITWASGFRWTSGTVSVPEQSPGAATFTHTFIINTSPFVGTPPGFGDAISTIEEGRDDRGPFCSIVWTPGSGSPHLHAGVSSHPCYPYVFPLFAGQIPFKPPPGDGSGSETGFDCSIGSFVSGSGTLALRMLYRPTNDPVNPGWSSIPGSAGQIEDGVAAVHAVAEMFRQYVVDVRGGTYQGVGLPSIWLEVDMNPANPTYHEFYKFRIQTHG